MTDAMLGGAMIMYALVGIYVWWLAEQNGEFTRRWLALLIFVLVWPLFLIDVDIKPKRRKEGSK